MQRSLAGMCFLVAACAFALAAGLWWVQFAVFSPDTSVGRTEAILGDPEIRAEITTVIVAATAATLDQDPGALASFVDELIASRAGAGVMVDIVHDAHARSIGGREEPVRITGEQMVLIVRDELVADLAPVTLPVAEISTYRILANSLGWIALGLTVIAAIASLLGVITRPERGEVARALADLLIALAVTLVVVGLLVPVFVLPAINDTTWSGTVPRLALRVLPVIAATAVITGSCGVAMALRSTAGNRRKQWSTPLSVGRYRDERRWS